MQPYRTWHKLKKIKKENNSTINIVKACHTVFGYLFQVEMLASLLLVQ